MIERLALDAGSIWANPLVEALLGDLHPGGEALTRELALRAGLRAGDRVLDVGAGLGTSARLLATEFGCRVHGLDVEERTVAKARSRTPAGLACTFGRMSSNDLGGPYDAVLSECALCLGAEDGLRAMARALRPGGTLMLSDVTLEGDDPVLRGAAAWAACIAGARPAAQLRVEVEEAGLSVRWHEARPWLVGEVRDRVRSRIDVDAVTRMVGGPWKDLVEALEAAWASGRLSYHVVVAKKVLPSGFEPESTE